MSSPPAPPRKPFSPANVLLVAVPLALVVGGVFGYLYWLASRTERAQARIDFNPYLRFTLDTPVTLEPIFTDADGDQVADPPPPDKQLDPKELVFVTLGRDADSDLATWKDFVKRVEEKTGKKVVLRQELYTDRTRLESIRGGDVHLLQINTGAVPAAVNVAGFVPLVAIADESGKYQYAMEFIVPADSPYQSLADFKAACDRAKQSGSELPKVALGNLRSHSSFKAPLVLLWKEHGLQPGRDYVFVVAGTQAAAIKGVCASPPQFPLAPVAGDYLARLVAQGEAPAGRFRAIHRSPPYPPACIGCVHALKKELRDALLQVFLGMKIPGSSLEKEFKGQGQVRFARVDYKTDWAAVREVDAQMRELVGLK